MFILGTKALIPEKDQTVGLLRDGCRSKVPLLFDEEDVIECSARKWPGFPFGAGQQDLDGPECINFFDRRH